MAIAMTLRGFNDLGRSVTPIFLSMGHFVYRFLRFSKKSIEWKVDLLLQNAPSNSVHLTSSFSCEAVSNASLRVKVCDNDGNT